MFGMLRNWWYQRIFNYNSLIITYTCSTAVTLHIVLFWQAPVKVYGGLTFQGTVVCTICSNVKKFWILRTVNAWISYDSQKKMLLIPWTLTGICNWDSVFCDLGNKFLGNNWVTFSMMIKWSLNYVGWHTTKFCIEVHRPHYQKCNLIPVYHITC